MVIALGLASPVCCLADVPAWLAVGGAARSVADAGPAALAEVPPPGAITSAVGVAAAAALLVGTGPGGRAAVGAGPGPAPGTGPGRALGAAASAAGACSGPASGSSDRPVAD